MKFDTKYFKALNETKNILGLKTMAFNTGESYLT